MLQIVPEEVHSYWHLANIHRNPQETGVWQIDDSPWITQFHHRHLDRHQHFVLEWYDSIAEVICRDLIFGQGMFDLQTQLTQDGRFAVAYLRRAEAAERRKDYAEAVVYLERYMALTHDQDMLRYAGRRLDHVQRHMSDEHQNE